MATPDAPPGARPGPYDAVVLAGGAARRFGGGDKPGAPVAGRPLIEWVADAVPGAGRLIVVGPPRAALPHAVAVREDPPGAGPVPALRAGLAEVGAPWLALLAADLPFLRPAHVAALRAAARHADGAVLVDAGGREQWLAGCWRTAALAAALAAYDGASLHGVLAPLGPVRVAPPPGERPAWFDCDTPEALAGADRLARARVDPRGDDGRAPAGPGEGN
ncbi:molybdenum cofactor guanylyltransferase [Actinomadura parmotrematis]|uniref:NTP transferase domain-containing protein n=1 Tax=Actinomadura parmotrematis TaxID=2864039 RepID=A0ABS7FT05_9ACTN|nr:NTP transferase domain-containing protein [Actinomadura parmotrematis]MBW8483340.1 NTP transferase domain-containing protein [Actinomadura parmotrematis]